MDMDADSSSEVSDFSDFSDLTDITERLWDSTDEEDPECDKEDAVVQEGRRLWMHSEDRPPRSGNKKRMRMDMEQRIAHLEEDYGPREFQETYKVSVPEFRALAAALRDYIALVSHKGVCSSGSYVSADLRLSMFLRYIAGG